jgi:hypothetical protein
MDRPVTSVNYHRQLRRSYKIHVFLSYCKRENKVVRPVIAHNKGSTAVCTTSIGYYVR